MSRVTLGILALFSSAACATSGPTLSRAGLTDDRYALHVASTSPGVFVSNDWMVENLVRVEPGPVKRKRGVYDAVYLIDINGDGRAERIRDYAYVLRLRHRRTAGVLWSSVVPLPASMEQTELRVLARLLVSAASRDTVSLAVSDGTVEVSTRRLATRILEERPIAVRGYEGYRVTFEVADVDQASLTPDASWERREVALVRPGFVILAGGGTLPGLLVLGHANLPEDFDATHSDFDRFLESFEFREDELEGSRAALRACAPEAELVSVARVDQTPVDRFASLGDPDAGECFGPQRPQGEPPVSFGVRREPFVAPAVAPAEPSATDVATPEPSAEPTTPSEPSPQAAESTPAPTEP
jgi:hypothetical protein